jgi:hypothetical protein
MRPPPAVAKEQPVLDAGRGPARAPRPEAVPDTEPAAPDVTHAAGAQSGRWIIDGLADVARAGPATASAQGVVMFNRSNQLWLAALGALPRGTKPASTPVGSLPSHAGPFPLAHGAAVRKGFAYWTSRGKLLRQRLSAAGSGQPPQELAQDGCAGTRVAVPTGTPELTGGLPALVAYISEAQDREQPLGAKLWVEGAEAPLALTEDGGSAHSVALVAAERGVFAFALEARTGMSPLHMRYIDLSKPNTPLLGEDRIVWVGGSSRPTTEFLSFGIDRNTATGLIALERGITQFGLARLSLTLDSQEPAADPAWIDYKNGIEPAPFAGALVCEQWVAVLARPASAEPDSAQELVWLPLAGSSVSEALVLARSRAFFEVSLAALPGGALLTYVADRRTWARTIRCTR